MFGKIWRHLQSHLHYFWYVYGSESKYLWALLAAGLGILATVLPSGIVKILGIIVIAVTVAELLFEALRIYRRWTTTKLSVRTTYPTQAARAQWESPAQQIIQTVAHPVGQETEIWLDANVNAALQARRPSRAPEAAAAQPQLTGQLVNYRFTLPEILQEAAPMALRKTALLKREDASNLKTASIWRRMRARFELHRLPIRFNGKLLRLMTEPTVAQVAAGELRFQRCSYFDGEASNELYRLQSVTEAGTYASVDRFAFDRNNQILGLESASVANIVGVSVLGVTADGLVIFVQQTKNNSIAPNALASTGSGSLELRDYQRLASKPDQAQTFDATQLILAGMLRELCEESRVESAEIQYEATVLTGYFRWIARAAKPEFTGLTTLTCSFAELTTRGYRELGEQAFTAGIVGVSVKHLLTAAEQWRDSEKAGAEYQDLWATAVHTLVTAINTDTQQSTSQRGRKLSSERGQSAKTAPRSEMSPSCEASWVGAVQYLAAHHTADISNSYRAMLDNE